MNTCVWVQGGESAAFARVPQNESAVHRAGLARHHQHLLLRDLENMKKNRCDDK